MRGFISYAHTDHVEFAEFKKQLRQVERLTRVSFWSDKRIRAGNYWSTEIQKRIEIADVCLLLASPGFADSDYIFDHELPAIADQKASRNTLVIPVAVKPVLMELIGNPFQSVPSDDGGALRFVIDWKPQRRGYERAISQINSAICEHFKITPSSPLGDLFEGRS